MSCTLLVNFLAAIKCLSFLRIYESVGDFIMLITRCVLELKIFLGFFIFWVWVFVLCILTLGGRFDNDNYEGFSTLFVIFL